jgi:sterol desaturase/sphingolipid hydroxylase (fatty acid hydroxylase superfamily)
MARIRIQAREKLHPTYAVVNMVAVAVVKVTVGHRPVVMVVKVVCGLFGEQDVHSQVQTPRT